MIKTHKSEIYLIAFSKLLQNFLTDFLRKKIMTFHTWRPPPYVIFCPHKKMMISNVASCRPLSWLHKKKKCLKCRRLPPSPFRVRIKRIYYFANVRIKCRCILVVFQHYFQNNFFMF